MPDAPRDLDDAVAAIVADCRSVTATERLPCAMAAGRYLAQPMDAPRSLPPFRASAMDGYALRRADLQGEPPYQLRVNGTSLAGHPFSGRTATGDCIRIFTGAALPDDLDTVVIQEDCRVEGADPASGDADLVRIATHVAAGDNVRPQGHDVRAGTRLLEAGRRLSEFDVGWLTACGIDEISVYRQPVIGIFSTGDELLDPGRETGPGQIYDANRVTVAALLRSLPVTISDFGIVADDVDAIGQVLRDADQQCDVVVTSGGVSVGDADWVRDAVGGVGELQLWKLNIKPGKPLAYGRLRRAAFFGLPGNPVSTIITTLMVLRPALQVIAGGTPEAPLTITATLRGELRHRPGREEFQRGRLHTGRDGLEVSVTGDQSSNRLASFAEANCLIRVPKGCADLTDGSAVSVLPFKGLW